MLAALLFSLLGFATVSPSSSLVGNWLTPNHSVVHIYACQQDARLCARLEKIGPKDAPRLDQHNPNASMRSRPLCGLVIGTGFEIDGADHAHDGQLYDPESGNTYAGEMQVSGDTLKLRGYKGIPLFGRTETWHRTDAAPAPACGAASS